MAVKYKIVFQVWLIERVTTYFKWSQSSAMDFPNPDSVTVMMESVTGGESGGEMPDKDVDIELPDIKKECLEYSMRIDSC